MRAAALTQGLGASRQHAGAGGVESVDPTRRVGGLMQCVGHRPSTQGPEALMQSGVLMQNQGRRCKAQARAQRLPHEKRDVRLTVSHVEVTNHMTLLLGSVGGSKKQSMKETNVATEVRACVARGSQRI